MGNYLRVRGEYRFCFCFLGFHLELPPRARRILVHRGVMFATYGTTSACAENTGQTHLDVKSPGNYLRVRGEYSPHHGLTPPHTELPPRARRIP